VHGCTLSLAALLLALSPAAAQAETCAGLAAAIGVAGATVTLDEGEVCTGNYTIANGVTLVGGGTGASFNTTAGGRAITGADTGAVVLRNLSFTSPDGARGGVELTGNTTPTVDNVQFLRNGGVARGGGLHVTSSAPSGTIVVRDSRFGGGGAGANSSTFHGGGAYFEAAGAVNLELSGLTFNANTVAGGTAHWGGGLSVFGNGGSVTLRDSTFTGNVTAAAEGSAGAGAAILGTAVTVSGNTFSGNQARAADNAINTFAGGLLVSGTAGVTLTGNVFTGNAVLAAPDPSTTNAIYGGGALVLFSSATLEGNTWTSNAIGASAPGQEVGGGAVAIIGACSEPSSSTVRNDVFRANTSAGTGGGLFVRGCHGGGDTYAIANTTFRDNSAGTGGAAVSVGLSAAASIFNSILWDGAAELAGTAPDVRFSDVCAGGAPATGEGNICADPMFAGTTASVNPGSPVIDAGSNALVPSGLTTAFGGGARLLDGTCDGNAVVDMGAAEVTGACGPVTTPPVTPPVVAPPITNPGQVLLCEGRTVVLIDLRRKGRKVALRGITLAALAGKRVRITADRGGGSWRAKVAADGSFALSVPRPKSRQTSYTASYGTNRSSPLKVSRNLTIVAQKRVAGGLRVVARHSKGWRVAGEKATVRRQAGCGKQVTAASVKFDRRGRLTTVLPAPTGADTIAVYRITTKTNNTFTLPIVVRR
jgi:hypothetical protein